MRAAETVKNLATRASDRIKDPLWETSISDMLARENELNAAFNTVLSHGCFSDVALQLASPERKEALDQLFLYVRDRLNGDRLSSVFGALSEGKIPEDIVVGLIQSNALGFPFLKQMVCAGYPHLSTLADESFSNGPKF